MAPTPAVESTILFGKDSSRGSLGTFHEPIEKVLSRSWNDLCSSLPSFESIRPFLEWLRRRGSISRGPSTSQFWIKSLSTRLNEKFFLQRILNLNFPFFVFMIENVVYIMRDIIYK